jgi:EmrB/QacA subfamily drug resistance transporter
LPTTTAAQRAVTALTGAALFMVVLDNLIVAATLPSIQHSLHASLGSLQWVLDAYMLAFAVLMLTAAALGDRYGRRRVFVGGVLLFTAASAAGALAPNVGVLVAARAVQGIGGAVIMPLTLTLLGAAFPPERRAVALGTWSAISGLGVALGPIVGGVLTTTLSWHWIFWVNVPIGLAVAALARPVLAESHGPAERLDLTGLALAGAGLLAVVWAMVRAGAAGWGSAQTLVALLSGAALLGAFLAWERRTRRPMVPLRLFGSREFSAVSAASFLLSFAMFGAFIMIVQFLSGVRGESPISAGLHTLFWTLMPMIVAPFSARLGRRIAPTALVAGGLAVVGVGTATLAATVGAGTPALALAPGLLITGIGIGLVIPNLAAGALAAVPPADMGKASGVLSTARQVGAVFGVSVGVAIYEAAAHGSSPEALSAGVRASLLTAAGVALVGALAAGATRLSRPATVPVLAEG